MEDKSKFFLEAEIEIQEETEDLKQAAASVIDLPKDKEKQSDLLYFSAIFVSSGENLNHAFFLPEELVAAEGTIINKALDIEHKEDDIVGHIYERAYMDKEGNPLDLEELASRETAALNNQEMHIAIAGIIYKNRFPNLAKEVSDNKWKVSMECYYQDFDIKVGDLILSRPEADALGLASEDDSVFGKIAKVLRNGAEIAAGKLARVLRGVAFSGCGVVKNPANPPSVILETAKEKKEEAEIVLDYDKLEKEDVAVIKDNNVTSEKVEMPEASDDSDAENAEEGITEAHMLQFATSVAKDLLKKKEANDRREELIDGLKAALREAVKTLS